MTPNVLAEVISSPTMTEPTRISHVRGAVATSGGWVATISAATAVAQPMLARLKAILTGAAGRSELPGQ